MVKVSNLQSGIRERIKKRMAAIRISASALDEEAGLGKSHTSDYLSNRKKKLSDDAFERIAVVLRTTPQWLLTESGPETIDDHRSGGPIPMTKIDREAVVEVGKREKRDCRIVSLNMASGACEIIDNAGVRRGVVIDPEMLVAGNVYAMALATQSQLPIIVKRVLLSSGEDVLFVVDNLK